MKQTKLELKLKILEQIENGLTIQDSAKWLIANNHTKGKYSSVYNMIKSWQLKYKVGGAEALVSKTGKGATGRKRQCKNPSNLNILDQRWYEIVGAKDLIWMHENKKRIFVNQEKYMKFKDIKTFSKEGVAVSSLCRFLGVSRSGYYNWIKNGEKVETNHDKKLLKLINKIYMERRGSYGYRRIHKVLLYDYGIKISEKTVLSYMRKLNIKSKLYKKRWKKQKEQKNTTRGFKNLVQGEWHSKEPMKKLFTDVSEIRIKDKRLFISAAIDGYNEEIVSWSCSYHNDNSLVFSTFERIWKISNSKGMIVHSDHGSQYTSNEFMSICQDKGITQSMAGVAKSIENLPIERFWKILKHEYLYLYKPMTFEDAKQEIEKAINDYNNIRRQTKLNHLSPVNYRRKYHENVNIDEKEVTEYFKNKK